MNNILLDYFFSVTELQGLAPASTAFLRKAACVVKPKAGYSGNGFETITSAGQVSNFTDNSEVAQLFAGGVTSCFLIVANDLQDAESIIEAHAQEFFTLILSSDFGAKPFEATKASLKHHDLEVEAKQSGVLGTQISLTIVDDVAGTVTVTGKDILVKVDITGHKTWQDVVDLINNDQDASALVVATTSDAGADAVALVKTNLAHGHDVYADDFKGVTAIWSNDLATLQATAKIPNHCAFYGSATNKAKNMFYAFGKLLGNEASWRNQQYIIMPFDDGINDLGLAKNYYDDMISFSMTDKEFGNILGFFVCGKRAIVEPYIKKNFTIDVQSKALTYVSLNQPDYTITEAALIEAELNKVIDLYVSRQLFESGSIEVNLVEHNFKANANIVISEPKALWRFVAELKEV